MQVALEFKTFAKVMLMVLMEGTMICQLGCSGSGGNDDDDSSAGPADYHLTLLVENSSEPLAGVPIWLGTDGTGDVLTTDASGSVTVTQAEPVLTFSYGYTYSFTSNNVAQEVHRIRTFLNYPLEPENTFYVFDSNKSVNTGDKVGGEVDGIVLTGDYAYDYIYVRAGNATSRTPWGTSLGQVSKKSLLFSVSFPSPGYLYAAQSSSYAGIISIPHFFDLVLNPVGDYSLTVSRTFDKQVDLGFQSVDAGITTTYNDMELVLPGAAGALFFTDRQYDLESGNSRRISVPELSGPLEGATLNVREVAVSEDGQLYQGAKLENVTPGGSVSATMHSLHQVGDYVSLTGPTLAGLSIDLTDDAGSDYELLNYSDKAQTDSSHYFYNYWTVYQYDASQPVTFAAVPTGVYEFPAQGGGGTLTYTSRHAYSEVYYGYRDNSPGYSFTGVGLTTLSTN